MVSYLAEKKKMISHVNLTKIASVLTTTKYSDQKFSPENFELIKRAAGALAHDHLIYQNETSKIATDHMFINNERLTEEPGIQGMILNSFCMKFSKFWANKKFSDNNQIVIINSSKNKSPDFFYMLKNNTTALSIDLKHVVQYKSLESKGNILVLSHLSHYVVLKKLQTILQMRNSSVVQNTQKMNVSQEQKNMYYKAIEIQEELIRKDCLTPESLNELVFPLLEYCNPHHLPLLVVQDSWLLGTGLTPQLQYNQEIIAEFLFDTISNINEKTITQFSYTGIEETEIDLNKINSNIVKLVMQNDLLINLCKESAKNLQIILHG